MMVQSKSPLISKHSYIDVLSTQGFAAQEYYEPLHKDLRKDSEGAMSTLTNDDVTVATTVNYGSTRTFYKNSSDGNPVVSEEKIEEYIENKFDVEKQLESNVGQEGPLLSPVKNDQTDEEQGVLYFSGPNERAYIVNSIELSKLGQNKMTTSLNHGSMVLNDIKKEENELRKKIRKFEEDLATNKRFSAMISVTISKMFPAGFFWQLAASLCTYSPETFMFALCTGLGEACAVYTGHILYSYLSKKDDFNFKETYQTALFLASGTICSGMSWQPIVNTLQGIGLSFAGVFVGTWIMCTYAFNFGLRVARNLYSEKMKYVEGPSWKNSKRYV
mmetsp:Transcript_22664/g.51934  ORF Transcript_22664/g.51934 Transcript_22664/m.51934 type:complete len:331 (-) Transcript_22664:628-1620(-)